MQNTREFPPALAQYIVEHAVKDGTLNAAAIRKYEDMLRQELSDLEGRLATLREATGPTVPIKAAPVRPASKPAVNEAPAAAEAPRQRRRRRAASPERLASQRLQGQYISALRQLPQSKRTKIQKIALEHGREEALKAMGAL